MPLETTSAGTGSTLENRVSRLERTNRLLMSVVILGLGLALASFTNRSAAIQDLVQARQIQLVDADGRIRMELTHDSLGTRLYIHDEAGAVRVGVAQFAHGGGGVALHGPGGSGAAVLYLKGSGTLSFHDSAGAVTARFPER
jgi:hypothetical protein